MSSIADRGLHIADWKKQGRMRRLNPKSEIRNPRFDGFTLLEVLIAVAIMTGIITVIYASFFTASRNVEQAEAIRDSSDMARTLVAKIADDISDAYYNPAMNRPEVITIFNGKKEQSDPADEKSRHDSITLTTLTNSRRPNTRETDLWEVGYFFKQKPDGSGSVMMRREKRELSKDSPAGEGGIEYEITDRVKIFQLRYNEAGDTWYDEWNSTTRNKLPKLVEIVLTLESGMTYSTYVEVQY
jgi:prepilin-type N-terminal cleavage/methylation domain-containing protein